MNAWTRYQPGERFQELGWKVGLRARLSPGSAKLAKQVEAFDASGLAASPTPGSRIWMEEAYGWFMVRFKTTPDMVQFVMVRS